MDDDNTAWTVEGLNPVALNMEFAHRFVNDPADAVTRSQLERGAYQVAVWCGKYDIPIRRVIDFDHGASGIIGHGEIPTRYNTNHHTDPGPYFDWDTFLELVRDWR